MNLKRLEYIIAIFDEQNISHAADRLFISRPALNHYLINLESEIGSPLFKRIHKKLVPTYIGSIYINAAKQILGIKKQTFKQIEDIANDTSGCLSLGITLGFGNDMLKNVLPVFMKRYPNYKIDLIEGNARELEQAVENGRSDFAIVGSSSVPTTLEHTIFSQAEVLLILPPNHPLGHMAAPRGEPYASLDLRLLENENFILMNSDTNIRAICNEYFAIAGFSPKILIECSIHALAYDLVRHGLGSTIILPPHHSSDKDGVYFFSLEPREIWKHSVAFRKGTIFTKAENYFIKLAKQYYQKFAIIKDNYIIPGLHE
jgi:DNA-binding transcriptional LysR family regulator